VLSPVGESSEKVIVKSEKLRYPCGIYLKRICEADTSVLHYSLFTIHLFFTERKKYYGYDNGILPQVCGGFGI